MIRILSISFLLMELMTVESGLANSAVIWDRFIKYPTAVNYASCQEQISDSLSGNYEKNIYGEQVNTPTQTELISNSKLYRGFLDIVSGGNPYAIKLAFQMRPLTDGSDREALDVALGKTIKIKPALFLTLIKKYDVLKQKESASILENYGDEFVDKLDEQVKETDMRIRALGKIRETILAEAKHKAIEILKNKKNIILEKKKELKHSK